LLVEFNFSYKLKMDLEDDTGELLEVTAFEGLTKNFLGVATHKQ